jgi:hypothetical protein
MSVAFSVALFIAASGNLFTDGRVEHLNKRRKLARTTFEMLAAEGEFVLRLGGGCGGASLE